MALVDGGGGKENTKHKCSKHCTQPQYIGWCMPKASSTLAHEKQDVETCNLLESGATLMWAEGLDMYSWALWREWKVPEKFLLFPATVFLSQLLCTHVLGLSWQSSGVPLLPTQYRGTHRALS